MVSVLVFGGLKGAQLQEGLPGFLLLVALLFFFAKGFFAGLFVEGENMLLLLGRYVLELLVGQLAQPLTVGLVGEGIFAEFG